MELPSGSGPRWQLAWYPRPTIPLKDYAYNELRHWSLASTDPHAAEELLAKAQQVVTEKYRLYEELASREVMDIATFFSRETSV
jgi:hypothetical protein